MLRLSLVWQLFVDNNWLIIWNIFISVSAEVDILLIYFLFTSKYRLTGEEKYLCKSPEVSKNHFLIKLKLGSLNYTSLDHPSVSLDQIFLVVHYHGNLNFCFRNTSINKQVQYLWLFGLCNRLHTLLHSNFKSLSHHFFRFTFSIAISKCPECDHGHLHRVLLHSEEKEGCCQSERARVGGMAWAPGALHSCLAGKATDNGRPVQPLSLLPTLSQLSNTS